MKPIKITQEYITQLCTQIQTQFTNAVSLTDKFTVSVDTNVKLESKDKPLIYFTDVAILKIKALVAHADKEVAWHGMVTYNEEQNRYMIHDIVLFPQEVTAATAIATDDYGPWTATLSDEQFNQLRFHGHSHVNMGVSPSAVDTQYQEQMLTMVKDFYLFMIINKRDEFNLWLYDVRNNLLYDKSDLLIVTGIDSYKEWAIKEYTQHVASRVVTTTTTAYGTPGKGITSYISPITEKEKKAGRPKKNTFDDINKEINPKNYNKPNKNKTANSWDSYYQAVYGMSYEEYKAEYGVEY